MAGDVALAAAGIATLWRWLMGVASDAAIRIGWDWGARVALKLRGGKIVTIVGRRRFHGAYPLDKLLRHTQEVHAAWLSGRGMLTKTGGLVEKNQRRFKRLILPDPASGTVAALQRIYGLDIASEVAGGGNRAREFEVLVRTYPGFWGIELTIGDPDSSHGWLHMATHLPGFQEEDRVFLRIEKRSSPDLFAAILTSYEAMWTESRELGEALHGPVEPSNANGVFASRAELSNTPHVTNRQVRIADLVDLEGRLPEKTLEDCTIYGPGVIVTTAQGRLDMTGCEFAASAEAVFIKLASDQTVVDGMLRLSGHFVLRRCRIHGVGIAGPPDVIETIMRGATP